MELGKEILAWTLNLLLIAASIALSLALVVLPFIVIMSLFPVGHGGAVVLMVAWAMCLFLAFMHWITVC